MDHGSDALVGKKLIHEHALLATVEHVDTGDATFTRFGGGEE